MRSLPLGEWLWPLATAGAALLTWFGPKLAQKTVSLPMPLKPRAELPTDEWCPVHDTLVPSGSRVPWLPGGMGTDLDAGRRA